MQTRLVRRIVHLVFVGGIAGMIAGSIADNNGVAITFGLVTLVAALGLILVTAVTQSEPPADAADVAETVESQIRELIDAGADEKVLRDLVRDAVRLGRCRAETSAG